MKKVETKVQVRYAETDQMGVVYHANYLVWFELGRTAFLEALGLSYAELEQEGYLSPVLDIQASYLSPARYGDEVTVTTWLEAYDGLRITYCYQVAAGERLLARGRSVHVLVRKDNFRPVSVRRSLPKLHQLYEKISERER